MNKNKQEYIDSINKIQVDDNLKRETLNKIKETKKANRKPVFIGVTMGIVFVLILSIALPLGMNEKNIDPIKVVAENGGLPKVDNFDNLYKILELDENYDEENSFRGSLDMISPSWSASLSDQVQEQASTSSKYMNKTDDYSETNVQVQGIDEADIVKTDGEYIYYISSTKIVIVDGKDPANLQIVHEIKYEESEEEKEYFTPRELYINKNKLIVVGVNNKNESRIGSYELYDMAYPEDSKTVAKVFNIMNKQNIRLEREVEIEGNYLTSRMIGDNIYFLANKYIYTYNYYDLKKEEINEDDFKPKYKDTILREEEKCLEFSDIAYFPGSEEKSYINIAGFNVETNIPASINSYIGAGTEVYVSESNIYVANTEYEYRNNIYGIGDRYKVKTNIYKFKLQGQKVEFTNVGTVPGTILNQFSMDEKDGYFRIATTDSTSWNNSTNNLYVLNEKLETVGKLENLAKGESIYSVRFMGDRAYIVTFEQVDPLFVIDLSNPTKPRVLGELKIPGYSNYLHPYDENHIIGFGEDTRIEKDRYGERVVTTGMKMALFNVTDPNNPKELHSVKIGDQGTYSELLNNHKALLFSKEKNIIAFPITISEDVNNYRYNLKFQGAIVYGLDLEKGFTLKGQIAHMKIDSGYDDYDYTKEVERIIYIKDTLFTLSKGLIKATGMNDMKEKDSLTIEVPEGSRYMYYD